MRAVLIAAVIALGVSAHVPGLAQGQSAPRVQVTFEPNGLVTLVVNGASAREVLSEWSRQGGSKFVNAERLASTPLTLEFKSQPEAEVIGSILRGASGYLLGPRREGNLGASSFELVYILPTSNPSGGAYVPPPAFTPQPRVTTPGAPDDEIAPVQGRGVQPPGPQPAPGPQPPPIEPNRPAGSSSSVVVPVVPVVPVTTTPTTTAPPPTTTAPPPTGRGGGGGGSR
jgi:hypothetical protein